MAGCAEMTRSLALPQMSTRAYRDMLLRAIGELASGPDAAGSKARDEIMSGLRSLHVARQGRRESHFPMYRAAPSNTIEIVRILLERMELQRHVPSAADEGTE